MKKQILMLALATTCLSSIASDKLTPGMETVKDEVQMCLYNTYCTESIVSIMDTEERLYKGIKKWIDVKPRQMMFEYDYMMTFATLKSKLKNIDLPDDVRKALQTKYINAVEAKADEMIDNAN